MLYFAFAMAAHREPLENKSDASVCLDDGTFIHMPVSIHKCGSKEEFVNKVTSVAGNLWDKMDGIEGEN